MVHTTMTGSCPVSIRRAGSGYGANNHDTVAVQFLSEEELGVVMVQTTVTET